MSGIKTTNIFHTAGSSGIWAFGSMGVMAYFWVALCYVYNDMGAVTSPAAAAGDSKPQMPA